MTEQQRQLDDRPASTVPWRWAETPWFSPLEFLRGTALPADEYQLVAANVKRLVQDLQKTGDVAVTHDLRWIGEAFGALGWNLARTLEHRYWPHDSRPDRTLIVALRRGDELIATSAARWMWLHGSLRDDHHSGRFFYGDFANAVRPRAECRVTAATADLIAHCPIVYSCGLRGVKRLPEHDSWRVLRLSVLLAAINWHWSWVVARTGEGLSRRYNERGWGFSVTEAGIHVRREDGEPEKQYHLVAGRIDHMRRQFLRAEYGTGASLDVDALPLFRQSESSLGEASHG